MLSQTAIKSTTPGRVSLNLVISRLNQNRNPCSSYVRIAQNRFSTTANTTASNENSNVKHYDIAIVGGGLAGSVLASALGNSGLLRGTKIALIDATDLEKVGKWEAPSDRFNNRTVQVTQNNKEYLDKVGVWDRMILERVMPYNRAVIIDGGNGETIDFKSLNIEGLEQQEAQYGAMGISDAKHPAYIIENTNLHYGAIKRIMQINSQKKSENEESGDAIEIYDKTKVQKIEDQVGGASSRVVMDNGKTIEAKVLVGTDGINSIVRKYTDIETYGFDYNEHGVVANVMFDRTNTAAFQKFCSTGPIAILPFPNGYANLIWTMSAEYVKALIGLKDEQFIKLVNLAFTTKSNADIIYYLNNVDEIDNISDADLNKVYESGAYGEAGGNQNIEYPPKIVGVTPGSRQSFPLRLRNCDRYVDGNKVLVGDAAHVMHPLAGQGLNNGLYDVQALVNNFESARKLGANSFEYALQNYNRQRYTQNVVAMNIVDSIHTIFKQSNPFFVFARGYGISTLNSLGFIKNKIIEMAMK